MTDIRKTVTGREIDIDGIDPLEKLVALSISFGSVLPTDDGWQQWWNHLGTAREVIRLVREAD